MRGYEQPRDRVLYAELLREGSRRRPRYCQSCGNSTQGGKPYCSDHLDSIPYVREIKRRIAELEKQIERVDGGKTIPTQGALISDILDAVRILGPITANGLSRRANLASPFVVRRVLERLVKRGVLARSQPNKGSSATGPSYRIR